MFFAVFQHDSQKYESTPPAGVVEIRRHVTMAVSGIGRKHALEYKHEYDQAHIVVLKRDDPPRFI